MLSTKDIIIEKHARIFISKPVNQQDEIWILFHGYAQNIQEFYDSFTNNEFKDKCFIIPEGLSRFYQKGMHGTVGSSWMTKENREFEIIDQKKYLDLVINNFDLNNYKINIFAFSQGASTAARWLSNSNILINKLIFWSGNIPSDILKNKDDQLWKYSPHFFIGDKDQFSSLKNWNKFTENLKENEFTIYHGDHYFTPELINQYIL
tara:strand:+ start:102 stop:719 length:618 start_codon:yes stop_codon:yes gene_type:complete